MVSKLKTFSITIGSWIIYPLSFLMPRNKNLWIFIGWHKNKDREVFADNSKYLFLHVANSEKNINPVWIGNDDQVCEILRKKGYRAYSVHSIKGIWFSLRAGVTIVDAVMQLANWRYSGNSKTVQLWHADGIKRLNHTSKWKLRDWKDIFFLPGHFKKYNFFITSSDYIREKFIVPSFDTNTECVKITGLPRYDVSYRPVKDSGIDMHQQLALTLDNLEQISSARTFLYMPTFRRNRTLQQQLSPLNFSELDSFLSEKNYHLVISLHPKFSSSNWLPPEKYSNVFFSNPGFDQYPLFSRFDVLITDYSSICIDFLMAQKPSIFYVYDLEEYRKNEGLSEEFWNYMPGPRVRTIEELQKAMSMDIDELYAGAEEVRNTIFKYKDGNSSARVVQEILKEVN